MTGKKSLHFQAVIGTVSGYELEGKQGVTLNDFIETTKDFAAKLQEEIGIYVSGSVVPASVYYRTEWGCPTGGEHVFILQGDLNPEFGEEGPWKEAVLRLCQLLKEHYGQSTLTVTFSVVDHYYLT
jgi:hypothetical protein